MDTADTKLGTDVTITGILEALVGLIVAGEFVVETVVGTLVVVVVVVGETVVGTFVVVTSSGAAVVVFIVSVVVKNFDVDSGPAVVTGILAISNLITRGAGVVDLTVVAGIVGPAVVSDKEGTVGAIFVVIIVVVGALVVNTGIGDEATGSRILSSKGEGSLPLDTSLTSRSRDFKGLFLTLGPVPERRKFTG